MKFTCPCGREIVDDTDRQPHKALFVADQDVVDLIDEIESHVDKMYAAMHDPDLLRDWREAVFGKTFPRDDSARELFSHVLSALLAGNMRALYQCFHCGRVHVADPAGALHSFAPEDPATPSRLLTAVAGERRSAVVVGAWRPGQAPEGMLMWEHAGEVKAEEFTEQAPLEARYLEIFEELKGRDVLLSARLIVEKDIEHFWRAPRAQR